MHRSLALFSLIGLLQLPAPARAQGTPFPLAPAGCSMAHCDSRMSDLANSVSPPVATLVAIDSAAAGGKGGIGCASNTHVVACTRHGEPPTTSSFVIYDADGRLLWNDGGLLGSTAWMSAPIVGSDGSVIAADRNWILRVDSGTGTISWSSHKPDTGDPISPVLVGGDMSMVMLATTTDGGGGVAELSVWDAASGALLSHQPIVDPVSGKSYVTRNTPAVSGNRAYVVAEGVDDSSDGRLIAIDVCDTAACGGRGTITLRWHYDFNGPSGSSPLLVGQRIFFDGRPTSRSGAFMAVADNGATPSLVWKKLFSAQFVANAAQDPRGGLWVYPLLSDSVLRLNADTGAIDQKLVVSSAAGLPSGYSPATVMSVSRSPGGAVVLTFGTRAFGDYSAPTYVAAIDVSSTPAGTPLWLYRVAPNSASNAAAGQYPIVVSGTGARRVVFQGSNASTFFVGEP